MPSIPGDPEGIPGSAAGVDPRICDRKRDRYGTDPRHGKWSNVEAETDG